MQIQLFECKLTEGGESFSVPCKPEFLERIPLFSMLDADERATDDELPQAVTEGEHQRPDRSEREAEHHQVLRLLEILHPLRELSLHSLLPLLH